MPFISNYRKNKRYKGIYGWEEQNEACWGVVYRDFDLNPGEDLVEIGIDGRLSGPCIPDGSWFLTSREAKKACLKLWKDRKDLAVRAINHVKYSLI